MTHAISLRTFPSMAAAYSACTSLYSAFKAAHKRVEKVGLTLALSSDVKGKSVHEIRCRYTSEHAAEARWFAEAAKTL